MSTLSLAARFFGPCFLRGHDEPLMCRDASNQAIWRCSRCHAELGAILGSEMLDGPQKQQGVVLGQPKAKARRVTKANIHPMRSVR